VDRRVREEIFGQVARHLLARSLNNNPGWQGKPLCQSMLATFLRCRRFGRKHQCELTGHELQLPEKRAVFKVKCNLPN